MGSPLVSCETSHVTLKRCGELCGWAVVDNLNGGGGRSLEMAPTEATVGAGLRLRVVAESDGALSLASFRKTSKQWLQL